MKSFIESECRSLGCEELSTALSTGYGACCESTGFSKPKWLEDREFVEKVLKYLVDEKGYCIFAEPGSRYIDSDGWFELEYRLLGDGDPATNEYRVNVYLTTHSDHDSGFEEEWSERGSDTVSPYDIMWDNATDCEYALNEIVSNEKVRNDLPEDMLAEIVSFLKNAGYLKDIGTSGDKPACESIWDTVRGLFGKKKKPENEEPQDEFFIRPYGGPVHQPNRYPGLIWNILGEINCDHDGKITKEQAIKYIKRLMPAIKDNPDMPAFEKTLYRVVNAIG